MAKKNKKGITPRCQFGIAGWRFNAVKVCSSITDGSEYCELHTGLVCKRCGRPATRECHIDGDDYFLCGEPICDSCGDCGGHHRITLKPRDHFGDDEDEV